MNQTTRYLESVPNYQNIEIGALVNYIVLDAVKANASDIHIEPWESTPVMLDANKKGSSSILIKRAKTPAVLPL